MDGWMYNNPDTSTCVRLLILETPV